MKNILSIRPEAVYSANQAIHQNLVHLSKSARKTPSLTFIFKAMTLFVLLSSGQAGFAQSYVAPCPPPEVPNYNISAAVPCENTHFDLVIGSNVGLGTSSLVGSNLTGLTVAISGNFTVNQNFSFVNCTVVVDGGTISVVSTSPVANIFTVDHSLIRGCQKMWQGIRLNINTRIVTRNNSQIEDAEIAIGSSVLSWLDLRTTTFNRNRVGLNLASSIQGLPIIERMQTCNFNLYCILMGS